MPIGRCRGDSQASVQPAVAHATLMWPPRARWAASHSHASQLIVMVPGRQGWCSRHSAGMLDQIVDLLWDTREFKHVIDTGGSNGSPVSARGL